jgi:hypothetical protein
MKINRSGIYGRYKPAKFEIKSRTMQMCRNFPPFETFST